MLGAARPKILEGNKDCSFGLDGYAVYHVMSDGSLTRFC